MGVDALAIIDRDGTIVEGVIAADGSITSAFAPEQLRFVRDAVAGLRVLQAGGYRLAIATNQPGAAKGQATRAAIERTNAALVTMLAEHGVAIAHVEVCLHHPVGGPGGEAALVGPCACRKPAPGMALALLARFGADPARSWMIGDSAVDVAAGRAAGLRTALVGGATLLDIANQIMGIG